MNNCMSHIVFTGIAASRPKHNPNRHYELTAGSLTLAATLEDHNAYKQNGILAIWN
jgi:hypothetical protein